MLKLRNGDSVKKMRIYHQYQGKRSDLVVERRTPELEVGGSILTQVAVLCP